jgi:hypothetical protein
MASKYSRRIAGQYQESHGDHWVCSCLEWNLDERKHFNEKSGGWITILASSNDMPELLNALIVLNAPFHL